MKLIHTADLHLDSPMESNLPPEKARERKSELLGTFSRIVTYAVENEVDAILISGDLFDSDRVTNRTKKYVLDLIASNREISFFYLSGNHDKGDSVKSLPDLPENLFTFSDEWKIYDVGEVCVIGNENPNPETLLTDESKVNVVMLHGQQVRSGVVGASDLIPLSKYRSRHIDYLALGHIHDFRAEPIDSRGVAVYSGCPEGRGFDECGEKGFVLLTVKNKKIQYEFVPFARRKLHTVSVDISACSSQFELETAVETAVEELPEKDLVKVILTGATDPGLQKDKPGLLRLLNEKFYFAKILDESKLSVCREDYRLDKTLRGEFVRSVLGSDLSETEKSAILSCGFSALAGEEIEI